MRYINPRYLLFYLLTPGDLREMSYLFQRLSVIIQRFNSVLIHESFVSADEAIPTLDFSFMF